MSVFPHGGPDLPPVDEPHVLVEICLPDILTDRSEQVDEGLKEVGWSMTWRKTTLP